MTIRELTLERFRNYNREKVSFRDGLNLVRGRNAQGKTNIVEAVFLCCVGRSPRTARDKDLIMWEQDTGYIKAVAGRKIGDTSVELYFTRRDKKRIRVNGIPVSRMGELMGNIRAVYFSPDDLKLVKESPDSRRRFLDIDLSQLKRSYFYTLSHYNKILLQRNNLLKKGSPSSIRDTVDVWNEQLAACGARVMRERAAFLQMLSGFAEKTHDFLTGGEETLSLSYDPALLFPEEGDEEALKMALVQKLSASLEKDMRLGFTTVGPHRDDIKILANGVDLRQYGSQGQQRTAALSMKIAELELFASLSGEYPVLLLDDVLSELDKTRQARLIESIGHVQTILTCTSIDPEVMGHTPYHIVDVENGAVVKETN